MIKLDDMMARWMEDPEFRDEYALAEEESRLVETLVDARKAQDLTQEALARKMGTTRLAVSRIEGGAEPPTLIAVLRYARAVGLGISIDSSPSTVSEPSARDEKALVS